MLPWPLVQHIAENLHVCGCSAALGGREAQVQGLGRETICCGSSSQREYDTERSRHLEAAGIRVLRFTNTQVLGETEAVLDQIWEAVEGLPSP